MTGDAEACCQYPSQGMPKHANEIAKRAVDLFVGDAEARCGTITSHKQGTPKRALGLLRGDIGARRAMKEAMQIRNDGTRRSYRIMRVGLGAVLRVAMNFPVY